MKFFQAKYLKYPAIFFFISSVLWSVGIMYPKINSISKANNDLELLDVSPKKNSDELYKYVDKIEAGNKESITGIYLFEDFVYPLLYGPFIFFTLAYFKRKINPEGKILLPFILALLMMAFDWSENFTIVNVLTSYPQRMNIANFLLVFTTLKWTIGLVSLAILIVYLTKLFLRKRAS